MEHAEEEVGVEQPFPTEGVAPAPQEEGADDGKDVVDNALVHLELSYFVLNISVGRRVGVLQQVIADLLSEGEVVVTSFVDN